MNNSQSDTNPKLVTLAAARAIYEPCLTRARSEQLLIVEVMTDEVVREYLGGAPDHPRLTGYAPASADWFNAVWQIKGEAGDIYPSELTDPRALGPDDLRLLMQDYYNWWDTGLGLAIDITALQQEAISIPDVTKEAVDIARGNSRWNFMEALTWALLSDHRRVAIAAEGLQRPSSLPHFYNLSRLHWLAAQNCQYCQSADMPNRFIYCQCLQRRVNDLSEIAIAAGAPSSSVPEVKLHFYGYYRALIWPNGADALRFHRLAIEARWPQVFQASQKIQHDHSRQDLPSAVAYHALPTGDPGRPSKGYQIYGLEHARRCDAGEAIRALADEAKYLVAWFNDQSPFADPINVGTVSNRIRHRHSTYVTTMAPRN